MSDAIAVFCVQDFAETVEPNVGVRSAATLQVNSSVSVSLSVSVAVTVAVPEPAAMGVPETSRAADMLTPAGRPESE